MNRSLHRSLFVVAASLSVVAVGCGVSSGSQAASAPGVEQVQAGLGSPAALAAVTSAGRSTAKVTTEKITLTSTTSGLGGEELTATVEGAFDAKAKRAHLSTSIGAMSGVDADLGDTEMVVDGADVYVRAAMFEVFSDGKPWIKISSAKLGKLAEGLDGSAQSDPGAFMDMIEGAGTVTKVGSATVRGVETTHYEATLDLTKALDKVDASKRKRLQSQIEQLGGSLDAVRAVPAEVWVDGDGFVRRFTMTLDLGDAAPSTKRLQGLSVTQTIELYDFDEPVEITVPKASDVSELDLNKLLGD